MLAYDSYVRRPRFPAYLAVGLLYALALMAKPMAVTLPLVLLLFDFWPLGRLENGSAPGASFGKTAGRLLVEKAPLLGMALASSCITLIVQRRAGAMHLSEAFPLGVRISNAAVSYVAHIGKMLWPTNLAVFYPHPGAGLPFIRVVASVVVLLAVSGTVVRQVRPRPFLLVGWLWYLIALLPVIGIIQVGDQAMADRYAYVPLTGLFLMIVWSLPDWSKADMRWRKVGAALVSSILIALIACTSLQLRHWRNSCALLDHALQATSNNYVAQYGQGLLLLQGHRDEEAAQHFAEAVRIYPRYDDARCSLGIAMYRLGRNSEAVQALSTILVHNPGYVLAHYWLGRIYLEQGLIRESAAHLDEALRLKPDFEEARTLLGRARTVRGK